MQFKVLKASLDGISGGEARFESIADVLREIRYPISCHAGWPSLKALHASIRKWAKKAHAGDIYMTPASAIVALCVDQARGDADICHHCGYEDGLDYGDLDGVESGDIEQHVSCPACRKQWIDVFSFSDHRELFGKRADTLGDYTDRRKDERQEN